MGDEYIFSDQWKPNAGTYCKEAYLTIADYLLSTECSSINHFMCASAFPNPFQPLFLECDWVTLVLTTMRVDTVYWELAAGHTSHQCSADNAVVLKH